MEQKKNKKFLIIIIGIIILAILCISIVYLRINNFNNSIYNEQSLVNVEKSKLSIEEKELFKSACERNDDSLLNNKKIMDIITEEKQRQEKENEEKRQIEEREKQYKENINYSMFYDEEAKLKFYYNKNLKISSSGTDYKFSASSGTGLYSTLISYEFEKRDMNNFDVENYVQESFKNSILLKNEDINISKISPITARYVEVTLPEWKKMGMSFFIICTSEGISQIAITTLANPEIPDNITEILDTIIIDKN